MNFVQLEKWLILGLAQSHMVLSQGLIGLTFFLEQIKNMSVVI
jgi:hypothetical protein